MIACNYYIISHWDCQYLLENKKAIYKNKALHSFECSNEYISQYPYVREYNLSSLVQYTQHIYHIFCYNLTGEPPWEKHFSDPMQYLGRVK